jgi:small subunit ribosomal protein S17
MPTKKNEEEIEIVEGAETAAAEEAAPAEELEAEAAELAAEETPAETAPAAEEGTTSDKPAKAVKAKAEKPASDSEGDSKKGSKRAERIGIVSSDKMTKTVTVRVDRLVKHPMYRKYIKRRKKFMAHDELGARMGDKVRIVETRPLSARKRWRVVEIIQRAEL